MMWGAFVVLFAVGNMWTVFGLTQRKPIFFVPAGIAYVSLVVSVVISVK